MNISPNTDNDLIQHFLYGVLIGLAIILTGYIVVAVYQLGYKQGEEAVLSAKKRVVEVHRFKQGADIPFSSSIVKEKVRKTMQPVSNGP